MYEYKTQGEPDVVRQYELFTTNDNKKYYAQGHTPQEAIRNCFGEDLSIRVVEIGDIYNVVVKLVNSTILHYYWVEKRKENFDYDTFIKHNRQSKSTGIRMATVYNVDTMADTCFVKFTSGKIIQAPILLVVRDVYNHNYALSNPSVLVNWHVFRGR